MAILNPVNNYFETIYSDIATAKKLLASTTQTLQSIRSDQIFNDILFSAKQLMNDTEMTTDNISITSKRCHRLPITLSKDYFILDEGDRAFATTNSIPYFEIMLKRIYFNLIDTCISELRTRFTERSLSIVTACFCLLFQRVRSLEKCNIIKSLLKNNTYLNNLNAELMVLHNGLLKDEYSNLSELAADFLPHRQAFPSFSSIIDLALTLPISTARTECCFSVVKKILAPQRLSMDFERKSHLVLLAFNKDLTSSIDLDLFVDRFSKTTRRISLN